MSKIPVTVCIIAKNEEKYIEECLKHLMPYGFEIVVTDTGSTDRTKEIAEKYADKVLDFEWIDDFSAARNFCAQHASNNWILALDCDEYIMSFDYQNIRISTQKLPKCVGMFKIKNILKGENGIERYTVDSVVRFYNKKRYKWQNAIHEQLVYINEVDDSKYHCFEMPIEVIHHGYNITSEEMREKQLRNLRLLEKQLENETADSYTWFQAGQSYYLVGNFEKAAEAYETAIKLETNLKRAFMEICMESLGKTYINLDRPLDAVNLLVKYDAHFKTAKYSAALADAYLGSGEILKALMTYIKTVSMQDRNTLGDGLLVCYSRIINIYREMGQNEMADMYVDLFEKCRQEKERIVQKN